MCALESCDVFFFNATATTEIYTLSLHDALPISEDQERQGARQEGCRGRIQMQALGLELGLGERQTEGDRKSTRLNSSHANISYAVFCLKKKKKETRQVKTYETRHKEISSYGAQT